MASRTRKTSKTPEQILQAWLNNPSRRASERLSQDERDYVRQNWEAGQVGHITVDGCNYECFDLPSGGFILIEWDYGGNICF